MWLIGKTICNEINPWLSTWDVYLAFYRIRHILIYKTRLYLFQVCLHFTNSDQIAATKIIIQLENRMPQPTRNYIKVKDLELHGSQFGYFVNKEYFCEDIDPDWYYYYSDYCLKIWCTYFYMPTDSLYTSTCTFWNWLWT